jgi:enoyl-CoA hydratase/carnithine racemase
MFRAFDPQLVACGKDESVQALLVRGAGERALCADSDLRAIFDARYQPQGAGDYKADFFREEYCLIQRLHRLPKPYVAWSTALAWAAAAASRSMARIASSASARSLPCLRWRKRRLAAIERALPLRLEITFRQL